MAALRFERVLALPPSPVANTVYFVRPTGAAFALQYVTGNDAVPIPVGQVSAPSPTLGALTLSGSLQIGTATSGSISGATNGSTIASNIPGITVNSGARTYSGTPTGSAQTIASGLVETLAGAIGSPRSSSVTVAAAAGTLSALTLSSTSFTVGTPSSGTITGATGGSTITASGLPTGLTINGPARTLAYDGTGSAGNSSITLIETLAGYSNSPRASVVAVAVVAASADPSIAITPTSAAGANPPRWDYAYDNVIADSDQEVMRYQIGSGAFVLEDPQTITSDRYYDWVDGNAQFIPWPKYEAAYPFPANTDITVQEGILRNGTYYWGNTFTRRTANSVVTFNLEEFAQRDFGYDPNPSFNRNFTVGDNLIFSVSGSLTGIKVGGVAATLIVHGPYMDIYRIQVATAGSKAVQPSFSSGQAGAAMGFAVLTGAAAGTFFSAPKAGSSDGNPHDSPALSYPTGAFVAVGISNTETTAGLTAGAGTIIDASDGSNVLMHRTTQGSLSYGINAASSYTAGAYAVFAAAN